MDFLFLFDAFLFGVGAIGLFLVFTSKKSPRGSIARFLWPVMAGVPIISGFLMSRMTANWWPTNGAISIGQQLIEAVLFLVILVAAATAIHVKSLRKSINSLLCTSTAIVFWMLFCGAYTLVAITVLLMSFVYLFFQKRIGSHLDDDTLDKKTDGTERQSSPEILWACVAGTLVVISLTSAIQRTVAEQSAQSKAQAQLKIAQIQASHSEDRLEQKATQGQNGQAIFLTLGGSGLAIAAWIGSNTISNR